MCMFIIGNNRCTCLVPSMIISITLKSEDFSPLIPSQGRAVWVIWLSLGASFSNHRVVKLCTPPALAGAPSACIKRHISLESARNL